MKEIKRKINEAKNQVAEELAFLRTTKSKLDGERGELNRRMIMARKRVLRDFKGVLASEQIEEEWLEGRLPFQQLDNEDENGYLDPRILNKYFKKSNDAKKLETSLKKQLGWWKGRVGKKMRSIGDVINVWEEEVKKRKDKRVEERKQLKSRVKDAIKRKQSLLTQMRKLKTPSSSLRSRGTPHTPEEDDGLEEKPMTTSSSLSQPRTPLHTPVSVPSPFSSLPTERIRTIGQLEVFKGIQLDQLRKEISSNREGDDEIVNSINHSLVPKQPKFSSPKKSFNSPTLRNRIRMVRQLKKEDL